MWNIIVCNLNLFVRQQMSITHKLLLFYKAVDVKNGIEWELSGLVVSRDINNSSSAGTLTALTAYLVIFL